MCQCLLATQADFHGRKQTNSQQKVKYENVSPAKEAHYYTVIGQIFHLITIGCIAENFHVKFLQQTRFTPCVTQCKCKTSSSDIRSITLIVASCQKCLSNMVLIAMPSKGYYSAILIYQLSSTV